MKLLHEVIRCGQSRVPIESIIECHKAGDNPEQIHERFDAPSIEEIEETIRFYERHKELVEAYMLAEEEAAEAELQSYIDESKFKVTKVGDVTYLRRYE